MSYVKYRSDLVLTIEYLINKMPSRVLTFNYPHQFQFPNSPTFSIPLSIFGCTCFVHILGLYHYKLDPKSLQCLFLGYSPSHKDYKCYVLMSGKRFITRDVSFSESVSYFSGTWVPIQKESYSEEVPLPVPILDSSPSPVPMFLSPFESTDEG